MKVAAAALRTSLKRLSARAFLLGDRLGVHVMPKHFYTPVPDIAWLHKHPEAWRHPAPMTGVDWNLDSQLAWLKGICDPFYGEVQGFGVYRDIAEKGFGPGYGMIESQVLHCFIRSQRPGRVIEIGSGASTAVMLHAVALNSREGKGRGTSATTVTCIEPFPKPAFAGVGRITHIREIVQTVPGQLFRQLEAGDLLFIDSSHSVKTGSDVLRIYLEIIPGLQPGVFVHIHDCYLPYLYPRDALSSYFGWQETSLLLALLTGNVQLKVLCCESALHYGRMLELRAVLLDYQPQGNLEGLAAEPIGAHHFPASLWLRTG